MNRHSNMAGPLMVLVGGISIGFAPIGLRLGLDELGPQAIALWRYVFALPFLFVLACLSTKGPLRPPNKFVVLGGLFFACDLALWHWSLAITSVANATFIVNLGNIGVGFVAWFLLKERPSGAWFLAAVLAVLGAAALSFGASGVKIGGMWGDGLAVMAAIFVSFYMLCSKLARRELGGLETIFWLTCVEAIIGLIWVIMSGETPFPTSLSGFAAPLFLALIVQTCGQGLIITGLGRTPVAIAGILVVIQPVIAAAVAWQLFNEPLTVIQFLGASLIIVAIILSQYKRKPKNLASLPETDAGRNG